VAWLPNGAFTYEHNGSQNLVDQFSYRIINEDGIFTVATVDILVEPPLASAFDSEADILSPFVTSTPETVDPDSAEDANEIEVVTIEEVSKMIEEASGTSSAEFSFSTPSSAIREESLLQELGVSTFGFEQGDLQRDRSQTLLAALEVIQHNSVRAAEFDSFGVNVETQRIEVEFLSDDQRVGITNTSFLQALKQVDSDLQEAESEKTLKIKLSNDAIFSLSISATAGVVAWALRGGALLASVMAATPIWTSIDPVRVLKTNENKDDNSKPSSEVEKMFE